MAPPPPKRNRIRVISSSSSDDEVEAIIIDPVTPPPSPGIPVSPPPIPPPLKMVTLPRLPKHTIVKKPKYKETYASVQRRKNLSKVKTRPITSYFGQPILGPPPIPASNGDVSTGNPPNTLVTPSHIPVQISLPNSQGIRQITNNRVKTKNRRSESPPPTYSQIFGPSLSSPPHADKPVVVQMTNELNEDDGNGPFNYLDELHSSDIPITILKDVLEQIYAPANRPLELTELEIQRILQCGIPMIPRTYWDALDLDWHARNWEQRNTGMSLSEYLIYISKTMGSLKMKLLETPISLTGENSSPKPFPPTNRDSYITQAIDEKKTMFILTDILIEIPDKKSPTTAQCDKLRKTGCPLVPRERFQVKLILEWTKKWFFSFTRNEDTIKIGDSVIRRKKFRNEMLSLCDYLMMCNMSIYTKMETLFSEEVKIHAFPNSCCERHLSSPEAEDSDHALMSQGPQLNDADEQHAKLVLQTLNDLMEYHMNYTFTPKDLLQMQIQGWPVRPRIWHDLLSYHAWTCTWIYAPVSTYHKKNIEGEDFSLVDYITRKNSEMINPMSSFTTASVISDDSCTRPSLVQTLTDCDKSLQTGLSQVLSTWKPLPGMANHNSQTRMQNDESSNLSCEKLCHSSEAEKDNQSLMSEDTDSSSIITNYHEASSQSIIFCDISRDTITSMDKNDATFPGDPAVIRLDSDAEQMSGNEEEEMDVMSLYSETKEDQENENEEDEKIAARDIQEICIAYEKTIDCPVQRTTETGDEYQERLTIEWNKFPRSSIDPKCNTRMTTSGPMSLQRFLSKRQLTIGSETRPNQIGKFKAPVWDEKLPSQIVTSLTNAGCCLEPVVNKHLACISLWTKEWLEGRTGHSYIAYLSRQNQRSQYKMRNSDYTATARRKVGITQEVTSTDITKWRAKLKNLPPTVFIPLPEVQRYVIPFPQSNGRFQWNLNPPEEKTRKVPETEAQKRIRVVFDRLRDIFNITQTDYLMKQEPIIKMFMGSSKWIDCPALGKNGKIGGRAGQLLCDLERWGSRSWVPICSEMHCTSFVENCESHSLQPYWVAVFEDTNNSRNYYVFRSRQFPAKGRTDEDFTSFFSKLMGLKNADKKMNCLIKYNELRKKLGFQPNWRIVKLVTGLDHSKSYDLRCTLESVLSIICGIHNACETCYGKAHVVNMKVNVKNIDLRAFHHGLLENGVKVELGDSVSPQNMSPHMGISVKKAGDMANYVRYGPPGYLYPGKWTVASKQSVGHIRYEHTARGYSGTSINVAKTQDELDRRESLSQAIVLFGEMLEAEVDGVPMKMDFAIMELMDDWSLTDLNWAKNAFVFLASRQLILEASHFNLKNVNWDFVNLLL